MKGRTQGGFFLPCLVNGSQNKMNLPNLLGSNQELIRLIVC